MAYYKVDDVPYKSVQIDNIDEDSGEVISSWSKPEVLTKTTFIALNTLAC